MLHNLLFKAIFGQDYPNLGRLCNILPGMHGVEKLETSSITDIDLHLFCRHTQSLDHGSYLW